MKSAGYGPRTATSCRGRGRDCQDQQGTYFLASYLFLPTSVSQPQVADKMSSSVAIVTGGGSGIGLGVTEHLINHHGYKVAIVDKDAKRAKEESDRLGSSNCLGIAGDITDYDVQCNAFVQAFEWGGNRLDLVFLNAGIGDSDSLYKDTALDPKTGLPKALNLTTIDVNLSAVLQGVHLARHFFTEKNSTPGGRIVITSSQLGLYANPPVPLYTCSKHGLVGLVRACAPIYLKDRITINAICPTLIRTNLMPSHITDEFHVPEQTTPMSTALKAFDAVLASDKLTGQTMELALDEVVFKQQAEHETANGRWMLEQQFLWEKVMAGNMPREPGQNAAVVERPEKLRI